jgi:predicted transcriptional regulator
MAKATPRIQVDPDLLDLVDAMSRVSGESRSVIVGRAVRHLAFSDESNSALRDVAASSAKGLAEISGKIDAIGSTIVLLLDQQLASIDEG